MFKVTNAMTLRILSLGELIFSIIPLLRHRMYMKMKIQQVFRLFTSVDGTRSTRHMREGITLQKPLRQLPRQALNVF